MVQISGSILFAAMSVIPILAAPVIESRGSREPESKTSHSEPKFSININRKSHSKTVSKTSAQSMVSAPRFETENEIIESRGKLTNFKKTAKIGGAVASGLGTAVTIGSMMQSQQPPQQRDLSNYEEALEARGKLNDFKKAAKIGGHVASGLGTAATIGSVVQSMAQPQHRDLSYGEVLEGRGKASGFKKPAKVGGHIAGGMSRTHTAIGSISEPQQLEPATDEVLEARGKLAKFKTAAKVGGKVAGGVGTAATVGSLLFPQRQAPQRRSFERREPGLKLGSGEVTSGLKMVEKLGKAGAGGIALGAAVAPVFAKPQPHQRDLTSRSFKAEIELNARRLSGAAIGKIGSAVVGSAGFAGIIAALDTKQQRDLGDVEAREPSLNDLD